MRLLNTTTLTFREFFESSKPSYAILSHRWSDSEVSFKAFRKGQFDETSIGYRKIMDACALARKERLDWIWIDSCCIDKRSSAELTEAINSMFIWYRRAYRCYVHLADVTYESEDRGVMLEQFKHSDWFKRGWTLQELLASKRPETVLFFDCQWRYIGNRSSLLAEVCEITGIRNVYLSSQKYLDWASVAEIMSWAAQRKTTRPEDIAYSLLGFFDVNMPLLYGEGGVKAFMRLQLEIIKKSPDESIFAWRDSPGSISSSLLALSPTAFSLSGKVSYISDRSSRLPYSITHRGLHITRELEQFSPGKQRRPLEFSNPLMRYLLPCWDERESRIPILLVELDRPKGNFQRVRYFGYGADIDDNLSAMECECESIGLKEMYVEQDGL